MYAIYFSDKTTSGSSCLFGVVKFEAVARELSQLLSFALRWDRFQIRYCRSPYLEGSIPPFAVYYYRLGCRSYCGFFKIRLGAQRLADHMSAVYPGIRFKVVEFPEKDELRTSNMDKESALF